MSRTFARVPIEHDDGTVTWGYRARSRNGGPVKVATLDYTAFDGNGGWKLEDRQDPISREHFIGNYEFVSGG